MATAKKSSKAKTSKKPGKSKDEVKKKKKASAEKVSKKKTKAKPEKASKKSKAKAKPAKKRAAVNKFEDLKPMKKTLNKTELVQRLADKADVEPKIVKRVLGELETLIFRSLKKKGAGSFTWPGIVKIMSVPVPKKKIPAIKKGTMVRNPFKGGIEEPHKGRPASVRPASVKIKVRGFAALKKAALT